MRFSGNQGWDCAKCGKSIGKRYNGHYCFKCANEVQDSIMEKRGLTWNKNKKNSKQHNYG